METKFCCDCSENKIITEFSYKNKERGYRSNRCKPCHRVFRKQYYLDNKEREVKNAQRNTKRRRKELKDFVKSLKIKCNRCSEDHIATLQFHHKNPGEKEGAVAMMAHKVVAKDILIKEIEKCEILCANCHFKEHYIGE